MAYALECKEINKTFGGLDALRDINLKVTEGEILGIIGPNGAGKTTLFNIISGALPPTRGKVFFKGRDISSMGAPKICKLGIARTYQLVRPFHSLTALENVLVGLCFGRSDPQSREAGVAEAMDILGFMGLGDKGNKASGSLTLVEKKHLEIARALATRPDILLLDEVVSGLTPTEMTRTIDTIHQIQTRGVTVIMIEHVLRVVMELCKRIVVLNYGVQIAEGRPKDVVNDPKVIVAYLGKVESDDQEIWGD